MDVSFVITQQSVSFAVQSVITTGVDTTVKNSDKTFTQTIAGGGTYTLADTTFEIYLDGILSNTTILPSMVAETLNITLT
jgi:hypothetical protein